MSYRHMIMVPARWLLRASLLTLVACCWCAAGRAADVQVWLLLSHDLSDAIVSNDTNERDRLVKGGWKVSGTGALKTEAAKGAAPLHRLVRPNPKGTERALETNAAKLAKMVREGFADEGALGFAAVAVQPGLVPVLHVTKESRHLWTIAAADQQAAIKAGWKAAPTEIWLWPVAATPGSKPDRATAN